LRRDKTSAPSTSRKFSFVVRLEVQLKTPEPAGRLQPVVPARFVRKRKPPLARAANSLFAIALKVCALAVAEPSPQTKLPLWPFVEANLPNANE
jgi:hypothetical protein